jgi:hypothetical protein
MATNYINLSLRKLYVELETEHNKLMQTLKNAGPKSVSKQLTENIKAIMEALNKKVHAFSDHTRLNIPE